MRWFFGDCVHFRADNWVSNGHPIGRDGAGFEYQDPWRRDSVSGVTKTMMDGPVTGTVRSGGGE